VINLGSGYEVSVGDTARLIAKIMNRNVEITTSQERIRPDASEVQRLFAANERARELLDWSPKYAGLDGFERGLEKTINWFSDPDHLRGYSASGYVV
jgi:dTDP-glucose 4,6-dehydratase